MRQRFAWMTYAPDTGAGGGAAAGGEATGGAAPGGAAAGAAAAPPAFAETLPEDIRGEAVFRDIKDLAGLAKSYHGASKLLGRDPTTLAAIPGPDDADAWKSLYGRLGRPENPEGYKLPPPPEGLTENAELKASFAKTAHEAGLSERQAAALAQWWNGTALAASQAQAATQQRTEAEGMAALKTEWGAAFDQKLDVAKRALAHYGDEKLVAYLESTKLGNDPALLNAFARIGATLAEDGIIGRTDGGSTAFSPAEARQQIGDLQADGQFVKAYMDARAPGHAEAVQRMQALYAQAYPEPPKA